MKLDAEARSAQARKAGLAEVENRRAKIKNRDIGIVLAYRRLTAANMNIDEEKEAIQFLKSIGASPNRPDDKTVWAYIALIVGMSQKSIRRIVKAAQRKPNYSAHVPCKMVITKVSSKNKIDSKVKIQEVNHQLIF